MPDYWTDEVELDPFELMTVPAKIQNPPQMGRGDRVIFHAVIHVRLFGFGEILGNPKFIRDTKWAQRWPWIYPCRVAAGSRGSRTASLECCCPQTHNGSHSTRRGVLPADCRRIRQVPG